MGSMNMYNHNKILRMLTRCITIAITFLFLSCESWYSYCFDINNNTQKGRSLLCTFSYLPDDALANAS